MHWLNVTRSSQKAQRILQKKKKKNESLSVKGKSLSYVINQITKIWSYIFEGKLFYRARELD